MKRFWTLCMMLLLLAVCGCNQGNGAGAQGQSSQTVQVIVTDVKEGVLYVKDASDTSKQSDLYTIASEYLPEEVQPGIGMVLDVTFDGTVLYSYPAQFSHIEKVTVVSESSGEATEAVDYAIADNWAYFGIGEDKDADLFLICPTVDVKAENNMSLQDTETKGNFLGALNMERGIYEDSARMYAPYYRQAAMQVYGMETTEREQYLALAYEDVSAAFSYYLAQENQGHPIILAGFSQGADMCYRLLEEYFGDAALYERLVAVYAIGWPVTEDMVEQYPQIVPAKSAEDIGVVISFDCEAPEVVETFINPAGQRALSINPLNWRTDGTAADKAENLGACFTDYSGQITKEEKGLCGCYLEEQRGVLKVTDVQSTDYPAIVPGLPEGGYHVYDYQFFYRNLQENVAQRLAQYMEEKAEEPAA